MKNKSKIYEKISLPHLIKSMFYFQLYINFLARAKIHQMLHNNLFSYKISNNNTDNTVCYFLLLS